MNTNTIALQTLIKQAAPAKLNESDTNFSWRHLLGPARVEALQGATPEEQVDANWNHLKLQGGSLLGVLGGAGLGALIGGATTGKDKGAIIGALSGAIPGGLVGNWLTYRSMRKNRGMNDDFSWRHPLAPAQYEGLRGGNADQQVNANWDGLKFAVPSTIANAIGGPLAAYPTELATYYGLKEHRLNKQHRSDNQKED